MRELGPRQKDIMRAMARGLTDKEIAKEMGISINTVKSQAHAVFAKFQARNRVHAVVIAIRMGVVDLEVA